MEKNFDQIWQEWCDTDVLDGSIDVTIGNYEGKDFLIVGSHEDLTHLTAKLNGYNGNCDIAVVWSHDNVYTEFDKIIAELNDTRKNNPDHIGTISRLERRLKQLNAYCNYRQWLHTNEIEEKTFEDYDVEVGFSDEYDLCCHCHNEVVRTSPDSYSWTPPLFVDCEGYVCDDCAAEFSDYVLEEYKNVAKSIPDQFNTSDLGLVIINEDKLENGLYGGQCDEPKPIIEALNAQDIDVWFTVYPGQFDVSFDVYVKEGDQEKAIEILNKTDTKAKEDPAEVCKRGLQAASKAIGELKGEGISYAKINSDGSVEARKVSQEEFVAGIKS